MGFLDVHGDVKPSELSWSARNNFFHISLSSFVTVLISGWGTESFMSGIEHEKIAILPRNKKKYQDSFQGVPCLCILRTKTIKAAK